MASVGKRYIIEFDKVLEPYGLYKAKGFNSLVFDENGLQKLEPYTEPEDEVGEDFHYEGLMEAWVACREMLELSPAERNYVFGYDDPKCILWTYDPEEVIDILKNMRERNSTLDKIAWDIRMSGKDVDREKLQKFIEELPDSDEVPAFA